MKKLLLALGLALAPSGAWAQCTGIFPPSTLCGNLSAVPAPPSAFSASGTVSGPGLSTVGDVATWANTTGTQLADKPPLQIFGIIGNNLFLSGPSTGGPLNPTFRAITQADIQAALAAVPAPTHQILTSGSGTYTTPANTRWIEITLVGGGGGGGGSEGSTGNGGAGGNGGNTCWNTTGAACTSPVYQAGGGTGSGASNSSNPVSGGTVSGSGTCDFGIAGGDGSAIIQANGFGTISSTGGVGGVSILGGNGASGGIAASMPPSTNSGAGGVGGSGAQAGGGGGGAGAACRVIISGPAATYTYAVGAAGTAGTAGTGTSSAAGTAGAAGIIIVYEHYGP